MRTVFIEFLVSTIVSVAFWQFGLAFRFWPLHPFLATIGVAVACGIAAHLLVPGNAKLR